MRVWQWIRSLLVLAEVVRYGVTSSTAQNDADEGRRQSSIVDVVRCFRRSHRILTRFASFICPRALQSVDAAPSARPAARHLTHNTSAFLTTPPAKLGLIDCMNISSLTN